MTPKFGYDRSISAPTITVDREVEDGVEFEALGADDEKANTTFVMKVDGERVMTRRPEPLLAVFLEMIVGKEEYSLHLIGDENRMVQLTDEEIETLEETAEGIRAGLKNSPLS